MRREIEKASASAKSISAGVQSLVRALSGQSVRSWLLGVGAALLIPLEAIAGKDDAQQNRD